MAIIYRSVKGSNLTPGEVDGNFSDLDGRVDDIETNPPQANAIDHFEVAGDQFYVHMEDYTVLGPYELPAVQWNFRGAWAPATVYLKYDSITANGKLYHVPFAHTSEATFDPDENDGLGNDYYALLLDSFTVPHASANANAEIDVRLIHANTYQRCTNASGTLVTIPEDDTADLPLDTEVSFRQCTIAGEITIDGETVDVIINKPDGFDPNTSLRGAVVMIKKIGPNEWDLFGQLTVTP